MFDADPEWLLPLTCVDDPTLPPDPFTEPCIESMIALLAIDPDRLTPDDGIDYLAELQRHRAWFASLEARALVAVMGPHAVETAVTLHSRDESRPPTTITMVDERRDEIAAAVHLSAPTVHDLVEQARLLHGPMRRTRDALADGVLGVEQARALLRSCARMSGRVVATGRAPDEDSPADRLDREQFERHCATLQDRVLTRARTSTPAQVRALADRAVARIDAAGERDRREAARRDVDVTITPDVDGLALLIARLDMPDAARLAAAIAARAGEPDLPAPCDATAGQRRVAALLDLACGSSTVTTHVDVVVDLGTLLSLVDEPAMLSGPAADGGTPITAQAIRDLLADPSAPAVLRRLVTDPLTGHLIDRGRRTYAVPDDLRAFIATRDGTCRFPGCRRRAARCQVDHAQAWEDGGPTDRANLGPLCVRHHLLKTHAHWAIVDCGADGSCTWVSPMGRRYTVPTRAVLDLDPPPF